MTTEEYHESDLDPYREIRSLIKSIASKQNEGVPSCQNLGKLIYAFRELHNLLQCTCNPYDYFEISKTLTLCFNLIAGSYQLTQCIKEQLFLEDRMIIHDTLFVGSTMERQSMHRYWLPYIDHGTTSLFASTGTVQGHKVLDNIYPLPGEPWTPKSIKAYAGIIPVEHEVLHSTQDTLFDILDDHQNRKLLTDPSTQQYWSMKDAVQVHPPAQTISADEVLHSIYRDFPIPKQQPSKHRGPSRGVSKKGTDSNQIIRGATMSLAANRLFCCMVMRLRAESPPRTALLVGPDGCGKSTLCQKIACLIGARVIDLNDSILQSDAREDPTSPELQECIQREFQRATAEGPSVILIRNSERMFISSSNRDSECDKSVIFRAMKPHVKKAVESLHQDSNVFILGTSSRPDDCIGSDKEDLISFYNTDIITMIHPDQYSRMAKLAIDVQKAREHHIPWTILSELASRYPEASWGDIESSIQTSSTKVEQWEDLVREIEVNLKYASSLQQGGSRISRMVDIETWVRDNARLFSSFKTIRF